MAENTSGKRKGKQGFASMSKEEVQAIAEKGGKASHGGGRRSEKNQ